MYDSECTLDPEIPLGRGGGSVLMIQSLLNHVHKQIPLLTEIHFEDKSKIECATEDELSVSKNRKKGTPLKPAPLYYLSIAFNGKTWYEKYFNARYKDPAKHRDYRERVEYVLHSRELKSNTSFEDFMKILGIPKIKDNTVKIRMINMCNTHILPYYQLADTFGELFKSIPKEKRCEVRGWIEPFMVHFLGNTFTHEGWIIDLPLTEGMITGGRERSRKGTRRKHRIGRKCKCKSRRVMKK